MNKDLEEYNGYEVNNGVVELPNDFVIYDTYSTLEGSAGGTLMTYYMYEKHTYKVVGVINTGLLNYYTYNSDSERYYLLENFVTQTGKEEYMNSLALQPNGYVVLPEALRGRNGNHNYDDTFDVTGVSFEGTKIASTLTGFTNKYDYTGLGLAGNKDNLQSDIENRIVTLNTSKKELGSDQVILSIIEEWTYLCHTNYPHLMDLVPRSFSTSSATSFFNESLRGKKFTFTFTTTTGVIEKEVEIFKKKQMS